MSISRTNTGGFLTDDDGSGTVGTILNNSDRQSLIDVIDQRWTVQRVSSTGTQNNFSITSGGVEADVLFCENASDLTLTGIAAPASPTKPGKPLLVMAVGAANVYLAHNSGSSSSGNKLLNQASTANTPIKGSSGTLGGGFALYRYDSVNGIWRLMDHDQGGYLQASFSAGNFTGNASMSWTLASGDRVNSGYRLTRNRMHYYFQIATSSVGGTPNTTLRIGNGEWGGFTATAQLFARAAYANDNGSVIEALLSSNGTNIEATRNAGGNWSAATDTTYLYGQIDFPVN